MHNGREFLEYVAAHGRRLKRNLKKNITYDPEIFDDVYQQSIIKVYDSIVKNDKILDDFEQYFFIAAKFEYILWDNRAKNKKNARATMDEVVNLADQPGDEETHTAQAELLTEIMQYLTERYGDWYADVYLTYLQRKTQGKCSYLTIAEIYDTDVKVIREIIKTIREDEWINTHYKLIYNNL